MVSYTIRWDDPNNSEEGYNVYKSTGAINIDKPIAQLGPGITEYTDPDFDYDTVTYVAVGARVNGKVKREWLSKPQRIDLKTDGAIAIEELFPSGLITRVVGNSVAVSNQWDTSKWTYRSDLHWANVFGGSPMRFKISATSTYMDKYGVYGRSGVMLRTIIDDMETQFITPTNNASIVPELIVGHSLQENDVAGGTSLSTMMSELDEWITLMQTTWPGVMIELWEPRPSFSLNTPQLVNNYKAIQQYYRSKDDGQTIFTRSTNIYEDPDNPGLPLTGYTDESVHPNAKGAVALGRQGRSSLQRIALAVPDRTTRTPTTFLGGSNRYLTGSVAASGVGVTGTKPTDHTINSTLTGGYTVSEALDPGWKLTAGMDSAIIDGQPFQSLQMDTIALSSPPLVSAYTKMRLGIGAQNIRGSTWMFPRIQDGGGNTFRDYLTIETADVSPDFQRDDELTFVSPPMAPNSGTFSSLTVYVQATTKETTGPFEITIIDQGTFLP